MEIIIVRQAHKPWGIDGHLYINRMRICSTVEHPKWHLPAGEYQITNDQSKMSNLKSGIYDSVSLSVTAMVRFRSSSEKS